MVIKVRFHCPFLATIVFFQGVCFNWRAGFCRSLLLNSGGAREAGLSKSGLLIDLLNLVLVFASIIFMILRIY